MMKRKIPVVINIAVGLFTCMAISGCRHYPQKAVTASEVGKNYFLLLSDVHLDSFQEKTGPRQNTGRVLWNNCQTKMDSIVNSAHPPAFILYTGDLPAHYKSTCDTCAVEGIQRSHHDTNIRTVLTDLRRLVAKNKIPLLYTPGNNDALSGDYFSFSDKNNQTPFSLVEQSVNPFPALNVSETDTGKAYMISGDHITSGYYAAKVTKSLRIIILNSVIFGNSYLPADNVLHLEAGNIEMNWLAAQLQDATSNNDKVYMAMHIPPGIDAYQYDKHPGTTDTAMWAIMPGGRPWLNVFLGLVAKYRSTVAGIFYGHTHFDELRLLYDSAGKDVLQVAVSAPGISVDHGNNPAFKLVSFDSNSKLPTDFTTWYTSPGDAAWGNRTYSFSNIFHTKPGASILKRLRSIPINDIKKNVDSIYTAMNGQPSYNILPGIQVKWTK